MKLRFRLRYFVLLILLFQTFSVFAQLFNYHWHSTIGDSISITDFFVDKKNNIISVGTFSGTHDFDLSSNVNSIKAGGLNDIFIKKGDSLNQLIWVKSIGSTGFDLFGKPINDIDRVFGVVTDDSSNIYVTGELGGFDLDPGSAIKKISGGGVFILKFNENGILQWARSFSGSCDNFDLFVRNQMLYLVGSLSGTVNFKNEFGTYNRGTLGGSDGYVAKMDLNGTLQWTKTMGGVGSDYCSRLFVDPNEGIFITGTFSGDITFQPPNYHPTKASATGGAADADIFLTKFDSSGNFKWRSTFGSNDKKEYVSGISGDSLGNVFLCGSFEKALDFDPGSSVLTKTPLKFRDGFLARYSTNGAFLDVATINSKYEVSLLDVFVDLNDRIYAIGKVHSHVDFDPSVNSREYNTNPTSDGSEDFFAMVLDKKMKLLWSAGYGGPNYEDVRKVIFKKNTQELLILGTHGTDMDFTPDIIEKNKGNFILSLKGCGNPITITEKIKICGQYKWRDGITYRANNNSASFLINTPFACDSLFKLDLTVNNAVSDTQNIKACDSYTWINGETYNQSVSGVEFLTKTIAGCDSLILLNLQISNSSLWIDEVRSCDPIQWKDGKVYSNSNNNAMMKYSAVNGCDSLVRLDFIRTIINNDVEITTNKITSKELDADSFQWLNCQQNFQIIENSNNRDFNPNFSGEFAVRIFKGDCVDTTRCVYFNLNQFEHSDYTSNYFQTYPNPSTGKLNFHVVFDDIEVFNPQGQTVAIFYGTNVINMDQFSPGLYELKMNLRGHSYRARVILDR